ncbi:VOC family protein [Streptomyces sp. NPDC007088]|uniref:VOC family protein n=1 Tax=Streptomyces sp. NPDC007088 TaxID=3364773 RepID=UPI0036AF4582
MTKEPGTETAPARFKDLALDALDHQGLADWWCAALGYVRGPWEPAQETPRRPRHWPVPITDPAGEGPLIWLNPVPEPKTLKNRLHLDVYGDVAALLDLGATRLSAPDPENGVTWHVLADPEGNEFCVFTPKA